MNMTKRLLRLNSLRREQGQSTVEFAMMLPMFLAVLIGLTSISLLFYSYVTAQLAVREATSSIVHDTHQTVYAIRARACNASFSLDPSQLSVQVGPPDAVPTFVSCSSLDPSEGTTEMWVSGVTVHVIIIYNVPLPRVTLPLNNNGTAVLFGPIPIKATSVMTIE